MRAGRWPVQSHAHRAIRHRWSELRAMRNRMLLRFAARQLFTLVLQLPPRFTQFVPDRRRPEFFFQSHRDSIPQPKVAAAGRYLGKSTFQPTPPGLSLSGAVCQPFPHDLRHDTTLWAYASS